TSSVSMHRIRSAGSAASEERHVGRLIRRWSALLIVVALRVGVGATLGAQAPADTMMFYKALDLEAAGKYRDAAPLFRAALRTTAVVNALLGLERVHAELGGSGSLRRPLDPPIGANPPAEPTRPVPLPPL